jgi:DNA-binding transcriptional LysR family regulator
MAPFDWNDLRFFLAMARTGSPTTAAMQLKVDHTTVRRRIDALEQALDAQLFEPRDRGFFLTPAGESLMSTAEAIESLAMSGEVLVAGKNATLSGAVRIGAPDGLGCIFLAPQLADFAQQHPELQIELDATSRPFNLAKREADMAISILPPTKGRQVIRKLTDCSMYLYATADYLEQSSQIHSVDDLKDHRMLGYVDDMQFAVDFHSPAFLSDSRYRFLSTNLVALYHAAVAGTGIGLLPAYMLGNGSGLRRVLEHQVRIDREIWLTIHADLKDIARYRAVADFIYKIFADNQALFL